MATREGIIRITADRGAFRGSMRQMAADMTAQGHAMARNLSGPMKAGILNVGKSMKNTLNELRNGFKQVMTLGGALAGGALIKSAVEMQALYRDIEFSLSKIPGHAMSLLEIQKMIEVAADKSGQGTEKLANAFHSIFQATGNAEFGASAVEAIGVAATASGEEIDSLAGAAQLMQRKFGISSSEIEAGLTSFLQLTGSGGKSLDELTGRFAVMAGEAAAAGMTGVSGLQQLLGLLVNLDSTIGEKADPGLKMMFQTMKSGSAMMKRLSKESGMKFDADTTGLEKIRSLLTTKKGRAAAELVFTADARQVFDTLAKPFDEAMGEAKEKGLNKAEALDAALAAFDKNIKDSSKVTMTYSDVQKKAADRMKDDPSVHLRRALDKVQRALAQPKMIGAINSLVGNLPVLAEKIADLVDWIVSNPWEAAAVAGGLKVGGSFLGGALPAGGKAVAGSISKKLAKSNSELAKKAGAAAKNVGGLATAAAGVVGALGAGVAAGTALNEFVFEPQNQQYSDQINAALGFSSKGAGGIEGKKKRLAQGRKLMESLSSPTAYLNTENVAGGFLAVLGQAEHPLKRFMDAFVNLSKEQDALAKTIKKQNQDMRSGGSMRPTGTTRGPIQPSPSRPGNEPVRG